MIALAGTVVAPVALYRGAGSWPLAALAGVAFSGAALSARAVQGGRGGLWLLGQPPAWRCSASAWSVRSPTRGRWSADRSARRRLCGGGWRWCYPGWSGWRGASHPVTFAVSERRDGSALQIVGSTPIEFSQWGIIRPTGYGILGSVADHGVAEVLLVLRRG